jgi:hypothetical protein
VARISLKRNAFLKECAPDHNSRKNLKNSERRDGGEDNA